MNTSSSATASIVRTFNKAINGHDIDAVMELMELAIQAQRECERRWEDFLPVRLTHVLKRKNLFPSKIAVSSDGITLGERATLEVWT